MPRYSKKYPKEFSYYIFSFTVDNSDARNELNVFLGEFELHLHVDETLWVIVDIIDVRKEIIEQIIRLTKKHECKFKNVIIEKLDSTFNASIIKSMGNPNSIYDQIKKSSGR